MQRTFYVVLGLASTQMAQLDYSDTLTIIKLDYSDKLTIIKLDYSDKLTTVKGHDTAS